MTLAVENMTCPTCPYIVRQSLSSVPGVKRVDVSFERKTATVTFDEAETGIAALTAATARSGFASQPLEARTGE